VDELVIHPRNPAELDQFLKETGGQILMTDVLLQEKAAGRLPRRYLVRVNPDLGRVEDLPQMSAMFGRKQKLLASSEAALKLCSLVLRYKLNGLVVGVNPRLQFMDKPRWGVNPFRDTIGIGSDGTFKHRLFDIPKVWSYLALWDKDTNRIPVAFLDQGFSPNSDFRPPLAECDMDGADLVENLFMDFRCEPGAATSPPTTGNSFFGDKSWHGNGVVTVAGGVVNNGYGAAGTGGQVVVPMLYRYGTASYAFEIGLGIRKAVLDGAAVINISAGYPCVVVSDFGIGSEICTPAGRAVFCAMITTELELAAALVCADAGLLLAIPFAGPVLAAEVCGAAQLAAAGAGLACLATLIEGDVRNTMEEGVAFALENGVPVVSISGNKINADNLPPLLLDFIDTEDMNVDHWQIIPGVIDGVICVGAAHDPNPNDGNVTWENAHFFGERVDIWAPIKSKYYCPPTTDAVEPDPTRHVEEKIGGTSAAVPYITGLIADMMAINPTLNPLNPNLTALERRAIPGRIRDLLVDTAYDAPNLNDWGYRDPTGRRRNLVRPLAALQRAAQDVIPNLGVYDDTLNFDEIDANTSHDVREMAFDLGVLPDAAHAPLEPSGTILTIPGVEPAGVPYTDEDWFSFTVPTAMERRTNQFGQTFDVPRHGLYETTILLITPDTNRFGALEISGAGFVAGDRVFQPPTADETVREFRAPPMFDGATRSFRVRSDAAGSDNVYLLRAFSAWSSALPEGDRFDVRATAFIPPDNNVQNRAVPLGGEGEFAWQTVFEQGNVDPLASSITITNLSIHTMDDVDWFTLAQVPPYEFYRSRNCKPQLRISWDAPLRLRVVSQFGDELFRIERTPADIPYSYIGAGVSFSLEAVVPGEFLQYNLTLTFRAPDDNICQLENHLGGSDFSDGGYADPQGGGGSFLFPRFLPLVTDATELARYRRGFAEVRRNLDQNGRVTTGDLYLIEWRGGASFTLAVELVRGDSIQLRLSDTQGKTVAAASRSRIRLQQTAAPTLDILGLPYVLLEAASLPPGPYLLAISHGQPNTELKLFLPAGATSTGAMTAEEYLQKYLPATSEGDGLPVSAPTAVTLVNHRANDDRFEFGFLSQPWVTYQVEYTPFLGESGWKTLQVVEGNGGLITISNWIGNATRFYRVRAE